MPAFGSHLRWRESEVENDDVENDEAGTAVKKSTVKKSTASTTRPGRASAALLAVPLAASMLLTGCGGDGKPDASSSSTATSSPTTTVVPTTSASPTAAASPKTDPNIPAAARAHTPAGAEAFVKYFIERWNVAWTVPHAGIVSPLCQSSSKSCATVEESATRLAREGHRYNGNPLTIKYIGTLDTTNPSKYKVLANLVQERRSEIDKGGKVILTDEHEDFRASFELLYTGHAWSMATIKIMK